MSVGFAERDWFRQQDADRRPVITLRVRRFTWVRWGAPVAIVAVLLAGAAYQEWRLAPPTPTNGKPIAPPRAEPAPAAAADAVAFPNDGFCRATAKLAGQRHVGWPVWSAGRRASPPSG